MSIDDPELEKQLLSLSVPAKNSGLEQTIVDLAITETPSFEEPKSTWLSFFSDLLAGPQAAMAFSLVLCFGLWMGWSLPNSFNVENNANTITLASNDSYSFSAVELVSSDGIYEGDLF